MEDDVRRRAWTGLLAGLVASGVAGIVNQVVWQRALKIFLGGSETLSAMIVVLVFLLGLGLGSAVASRWAPRVANPLRALATVELALALGNALVAVLLGLDITRSVYQVQQLAVAAHIPLRAVYALGSAGILLPPTLLMGATLPLASEGCQRQLGAATSRLVPVLFFVNTVGAAFGAWSASALLLPALGQRASLLVAVTCNGTAAALIATLARSADAAPAVVVARSWSRLTREEWLGGALGFLALGYEMALFRVLALAHQPVPTTFATGLGAYLLAWSLGVALALRVGRGLPALALACGAIVAGVPALYHHEVYVSLLPYPVAIALYVSPCVGFGLMYGQLVARSATDWGRDVGRYAAINTLGSCAGVLAFTLVGYEMPQQDALLALALGFVAVGLVELPLPRGSGAAGAGLAATGAAALLIVGWRTPYTMEEDEARTYWGRDGVVEVAADHNVYIDGLWHTKLSDQGDHIGSAYSWLMAFAAVLAHDELEHGRALVVGGGVGVSSGTLARVRGMQVDVYEIDHTLQRVLRDYPEGSLNAATTPGVRWMWQDARTGMALNPQQYDIILSAPLYLRQAGSSLLLSREYLRLAKSRLAPDGVLAVYSNEGSPAQTRLIQSTLASLFQYRVTWYEGLLTVASDHPITMSRERLEARLQRPDRLYREAAALDRSLQAKGGLWSWYDGDQYAGVLADRVVTDDQPLVEYPELADWWVGLAPETTP